MDDVRRDYEFTIDNIDFIRTIDHESTWVRAWDDEGMEVELSVKGLTRSMVEQWLAKYPDESTV